MTKRIFTILGAICLVLFATIVIKAQIVDVPATSFVAEDLSEDWQIAWGGWGDYMWRQTGATETYCVAPVYLPDSVLIRYMRAHYLDNSAQNASIGITRTNKYTGAHNTVYMITTSGTSASIRFSTDFSASPSPGAALTNSASLSWHAFCSYSGTDSDGMNALFKFYGITISVTPYP